MTLFLQVVFVIALIFGVTVFFGAPYVPSKRKYINRAFSDLYPLGKDDLLVDIGSGDGVVLREAAKKGAQAIGYEINPILFMISKLFCYGYKNINVSLVDYWSAHLPNNTTVVYVFSVSRDMKKIINWMQKETDKLNRDLYLINFGSELKGIKTDKKIGAYRLYVFHPLHVNKPQV